MAEILPFTLYPFDEHDKDHLAIAEHVTAGDLPPDTLFRLASIGINVVDPRDDRRGLQYTLLQDLIDNGADHSKLRKENSELLEDNLPDAIVDIHGRQFEAYRQLNPMYYALGNLARVIRESRAERGLTATQTPPGYWRGYDANDYEKSLCAGLARPIWRTIIRRIHPEWLQHPEDYYPNRTLSFFTTYELSSNTIRRRMIGHTVISDTAILDIYAEAEKVGIKGIGPQGRESLRRLLEDEHLELSQDALVEPAN